MSPVDWNPATYHELSDPQFSWGESVVERLPSTVGKVIDLGCGTGRVTAKLLARLPSVTGVANDSSKNMLDQARSFLERDFAKRISFVLGDMTKLPFANEFDGVFSSAAFHWVPDHDLLFARIFKMLRAGGWLESQFGGSGNLQILRKRVRDIINAMQLSTPRERNVVHYENLETTSTRLSVAGFEAINVWQEAMPTIFPDESRFAEFLSEIYFKSVLSGIQLPERAQLIKSVVKLYEKDETPFCLDYQRLNISARKSCESNAR